MSKPIAVLSQLTFTVGPRVVHVVYDYYPWRLNLRSRMRGRYVIRAITHQGERVHRGRNPGLWNELRQDFLIAHNHINIVP